MLGSQNPARRLTFKKYMYIISYRIVFIFGETAVIPRRKNELEKSIQDEQRELRGLHLPYRQRRLVALYDGSNAPHIANLLGVAPSTINNWLKDPRVIDAIARRDDIEDTPIIAGRVERKEFWSHVMQAETYDINHRLKASELLGKSECDFSETRVLKGAGASTTVIVNTGIPRAPGENTEVSVDKDGETQDIEVEKDSVVVLNPEIEDIF